MAMVIDWLVLGMTLAIAIGSIAMTVAPQWSRMVDLLRNGETTVAMPPLPVRLSRGGRFTVPASAPATGAQPSSRAAA